MAPRLIRICKIQWWCSISLLSTGYSFFAKFGPKIQNCQFKLKLVTSTDSNMQKSMVVFNFSVSPEIPFLGKFCPKYQNHRFKLKFGTETNLNMQNSMVMLIFFCLWPEIPFLGKFGPKYQNCKIKLKFDTGNHFHNIFRLFMFYQIFLSPSSETMRNYYL